ncbi:MAG TPA: metal ABC transporter ATP-binding protein [Dehalococcoidales bacterium]|nr:metal ABC transporter ATP-binding protein [Dehalococcoidales bacterium]
MVKDLTKTLPVTTSRLNIGYKNEIVVPDINFELGKGEAVALIGTNGSGKSTLLKTIVGLIPVLGGELRIFGQPPGKVNRAAIAYLGQFHSSAFILPIRAIDVVRMGRFPVKGLWGRMDSEDDDIIKQAMKTMGVENLAEKPVRSLSGGQQQRIFLSQVLAQRAGLLVLDEPTAGLDAGGRELYLQALHAEMRRGASIISATHDVQEEAAICNHVLLLARKVVASGTCTEVMTPENLLQTFGVVIAGDSNLHVLESPHGHDEPEKH